jgi:hypothetical protein
VLSEVRLPVGNLESLPRNRAEEAREPKIFIVKGRTPSSVSATRELCF